MQQKLHQNKREQNNVHPAQVEILNLRNVSSIKYMFINPKEKTTTTYKQMQMSKKMKYRDHNEKTIMLDFRCFGDIAL